ncbi:MAG TPA: universal stress protein [Micromonosporaceae bacterium]
MANGTNAAVVVGVDGSPASERAIGLAAEEAVGQGRSLRLLHAFDWSEFGPDDGSPYDSIERLLQRAADQARAAAPGVDATTETAEGKPVTVLLRAAAAADLLAIGDGNLASYGCLPTAATAVRIAAEADCSVLVTRDAEVKPGPVLVGIDPSPRADHALGHAFDIATHRRADLVVLHVNEEESGNEAGGPVRSPIDPALADRVANWQRRYPSVHVDLRGIPGDPMRVLVDEASRAALVVVGARGELPTRSLLGAVSMGVLHHAPCPVLVVRGPKPG